MGLKVKISPKFGLNLFIFLILGSFIANNLFSFDLFWTEPIETKVDFSKHTPMELIYNFYPLKIIQAENSMYYGIWHVMTEEVSDLFFFGSTTDHNDWSNFTPLDEIFSDLELSYSLRNCDFLIFENNTIALFGAVLSVQYVNDTWNDKINLIMSLSNDRGLSWSDLVEINSTDLQSAYFGVYFDNDIKFWIIEEDSAGEVTNINIWNFNESTTSIIQTYGYHPETTSRIYWGAVTFNQNLIFLTREDSTNHLLIFDGTQWDQIPISLIEDDLKQLTVIGSDLFLIYTSLHDTFYIGKVHINDQGIKIADSTKLVSGLNWDVIWPIQNSKVPTFFLTTHHNDIASIRNSFNWSTVIFTFLISLIFIIIYVSPILSSVYSRGT